MSCRIPRGGERGERPGRRRRGDRIDGQVVCRRRPVVRGDGGPDRALREHRKGCEGGVLCRRRRRGRNVYLDLQKEMLSF